MSVSVIDATSTGSTGTVMVSGNMPAFSAYLGSTQTITSSTYTKIQINTKEFDTNSYYDASTNYRFTPLVAGYYQFNASLYPSTTTSLNNCVFYKNGSLFKGVSSGAASSSTNCSALIYMNGTTDYVELYGFLIGVSPAYAGSVNFSYFQAAMVRAT